MSSASIIPRTISPWRGGAWPSVPVAQGLSNREIADRLFLALTLSMRQYPQTILWYLYAHTMFQVYCLCIEQVAQVRIVWVCFNSVGERLRKSPVERSEGEISLKSPKTVGGEYV